MKKYRFTFYAMFFICSLLSANEIHVYPDAPNALQKAINDAKSGDQIIIHKGDYYEILKLIGKSNISIVAAGDGPAKIWGVMKEFTEDDNNRWAFVRKEQNKNFGNQQWIYEATIPKKYQLINNTLRPYWIYRNNFYLSEDKMLWSYTDQKSFSERSAMGTKGEGVLFEKDKIVIALNAPIQHFPGRQYITYSGQVLKVSTLNNVTIDGGKDQMIQFMYAGRYCVVGEGRLQRVHFKNIKFINPNIGFYFFGCSGDQLTIENCALKKVLPFKTTWSQIKNSTTMEGTGIVYAQGTLKELLVRGNLVEGFFNGIMALPGNAIIEDNHFKNIGDDAIELDGPAVNTVVRRNFVENCFVSFSLTPVEKGPVYIYDNLVYSDVDQYPYKLKKDKTIRFKEPRLIKFTNLVNGKKLKNGKMMKVSGNVHIYYNTFISKKLPLTLGNYGKKEYSPVQSSFYNNIFVSEGVLTRSTGFAEDGVDIDNNVFFSSFKDKSEDRLFIGWNGPNHSKTLKNTAQWSDNKFLKLKYEFKRGDFHWCKKSRKALDKVNLKNLPATFPDADQLNQRSRPGAATKN